MRISKHWSFAFNHPFRTNWHWFHFVYLGWDRIVWAKISFSMIVMGFGVTFVYDNGKVQP